MRLVAVALLLAACSAPQRGEQQTPQSLIVGGTEVPPGEWPDAVAITSGGLITCSGVLVNQRIVLTAAHCLKGLSFSGWHLPEELKDWGVYLGRGVDGGNVRMSRPVVKAGRHPLYNRTSPFDVYGKYDFAFLELKEPVVDVEPVPLLSDAREAHEVLSKNHPLQLVGFGFRDAEAATAQFGRKFQVDTKIKGFSRSELHAGDQRGDACGGDSGGPAYAQLANGDWRLVGIASRGPSPCANDERSGKWGLASETLCWLQKDAGLQLGADDCDAAPVRHDLHELRSLSFYRICTDPDATPAQKHTVAMLKIAAGIDADAGCSESLQTLRERAQLDLRRMHIRDVTPLLGLSSLVAVNLAENWISDPAPLALLTALKSADLTANAIEDFSAMSDFEAHGGLVLGKDVQLNVIP